MADKPFMEYGLVVVEFDKEMIDSKSESELFPSQEILMNFGDQLWTVSGYDDVPEEIYQIPEVREYFQSLHRAYPGWLALLNFETHNNLGILFCLLPTAPQRAPDGRLRFNMAELDQVLNFDVRACSRLVDAGLVSRELISRQCYNLRQLLGLN